MLLTFATTQNMLSKNQIRENKLKQFYGNDTVLQFDE